MCTSRGHYPSAPAQKVATARRYAAVLLSLFPLACAIDDRTLVSGSSNGAGGGRGGNAGSAPVSSAGAVAEPVDLPLCIYDGSVEPECETLVDNAGFGSDTSGWKHEDGTFGGWAAANAAGGEASGSLLILNPFHGKDSGVAPGAAGQCIEAIPDAVYDFAGDVFIPAGQGAGLEGAEYEGQAGLGMFFFGEANCGGMSIGNIDSPLRDETEKWVHVTGYGRAPEGTASVMIRLITLKPIRQFALKASFDNVFVRQR